MYLITVTRTTGGVLLEREFAQLDAAKAFFNDLVAREPYVGVMVILAEKKGHSHSAVVDAAAIPDRTRPKVTDANNSGFASDR